jgi:hypothetical protein
MGQMIEAVPGTGTITILLESQKHKQSSEDKKLEPRSALETAKQRTKTTIPSLCDP